MKKVFNYRIFISLTISFLLANQYARPQGFTFDIQPPQKTINVGDTTSFDIVVTPTGGFSASINFSLELPNCIDNYISITPAIANSPYNNIKIKISNTANISPSVYTININGTNGVTNYHGTCSLNILPNPNGFNWTVYQPNSSGLQSSVVVQTAVDNEGNTWIATGQSISANNYGYLTKYDGNTWDVYYDTRDTLYDNCDNIISTSNNTFAPWDYLTAFAIDGLGNKWLGRDGIVRIDSSGNLWHYIAPTPLPGNTINSIEIDSLNQAWIATNGGFTIFNNNLWTNYDMSNSILPSNYIHEIAFDHLGNTWFGCSGSNLVKFDGTFFTIYNPTNSNLPSPLYIDALTIDSLNNVWIGTRGQGIIKFDGVNITNYRSTNSTLKSNYITGLAIWNSCICALAASNSSYNAWLSIWDGSNWINFDSTNSPFPSPISWVSGGVDGDLYVNRSDNSLWISATYTGLIHIIDSTFMNVVINSITENNSYINSDIKVFPNPAINVLNFGLDNISSVEIYDVSSKLVLKKENDNLSQVDISGLVPGYYTASIIMNNKNSHVRFLKALKN